jgi:hypothetical protein
VAISSVTMSSRGVTISRPMRSRITRVDALGDARLLLHQDVKVRRIEHQEVGLCRRPHGGGAARPAQHRAVRSPTGPCSRIS